MNTTQAQEGERIHRRRGCRSRREGRERGVCVRNLRIYAYVGGEAADHDARAPTNQTERERIRERERERERDRYCNRSCRRGIGERERERKADRERKRQRVRRERGESE